VLGFTHHDPLEDTEREGSGQRAGLRRTRFTHHDPLEDTERTCNPRAPMPQPRFTHHDPLEDTESPATLLSPLPALRVSPITIRLRILKVEASLHLDLERGLFHPSRSA